MKIRNKISFTFVIIFTLLLSLVVGFLINKTSTIIKQEVFNNLKIKAHLNVQEINSYLEDKKNLAKTISQNDIFINFLNDNFEKASQNYKDTEDYLNKIVNIYPEIFEISILDKNSKLVISTNKDKIDKEHKEAFNNLNNNFFISDISKSSYIDDYFFEVFTFIKSEDENIGAIILSVRAQELYAILYNKIGIRETNEVYLVNKDGLLVSPLAMSKNVQILKQKISTDNFKACQKTLQKENSNENVYTNSNDSFYNYRNYKVLGVYAPIKEMNWCLLSEVQEQEAGIPMKNLIIIFIPIVGFALIVYLAVSYFLSSSISRPIEKLNYGTKLIKKGNLNYKVGTNLKDEIGELSRSFDKMTETIKKSKASVDRKVKRQTKILAEQKKELEKKQKSILKILQDVKKEKEKSEFLAHDLEKFKLAVDEASDHIVISDAAGKILYANKAAEKITGYKLKEIINTKIGKDSLWGGLMNKDFYEKMWNTIKVKKKTFNSNVINVRKNGEKYDATISMSPILNKSKEVVFFVVIKRDVTKEKEIDRAKTELVSLASHQLRTPLSSVNWYTEMLLAGDAGKINTEQKEFLKEIYNGNQRMVDLVNSLLNVSRIDLGTLEANPKFIDLKKVSQAVVKELAPQIKNKKINFKEVYSSKLPKIKIDKKLIYIVFQNYLSNALKYTPEKGKVRLEIIHKKRGAVVLKRKIKTASVLIKIIDNGYGIPKEQQDKIFTKLFRADNVKEKDTEGTGLGLYIVKSIIERAEGKTWFESKENKGSIFYALIPVSGIKKSGKKKS